MKFGTDGVRGVANSELTASFALDLGRAAGRVLAGDARAAVVGGDPRASTPMLESAFVAGLASEGVTVYRLGTVPTPAVAYESARRNVMGAMISASHNPYLDNGIKLFAPGGLKLADDIESRIEGELADLPAPAGEPGPIHQGADVDAYVDHVLGVLDGRSLSGLRVVVDAANGAASALAPRVLAAAGAAVTAIHVDPDGRNINAGCGATDPASMAAAVLAQHADLGIALDGDADRVMAVDANGDVVDGDHILAVCALDLRRRGALRHDTVVVTVMANLGFRIAMGDARIDVVETAVGDRYVLEALDAGRYSLGGEQSGHVIFRDVATTGDGMLTGLVLADAVRRTGQPLHELASVMTRLPQVLLNVTVADRVPDAAADLAAEIAAVERDLGERGRVLVRPSGTEPMVRVMVEAPTEDAARRAADHLADVARRRWSAAGSGSRGAR